MTSLWKSPPPLIAKPVEPVTMPTPGDVAERTAKKEAVKKQAKRRGRRSTILTALSEGGLGG